MNKHYKLKPGECKDCWLHRECEDLIFNKIGLDSYEKNMPKIAKELYNRYIQPELVIDREK